MGAKRSNSVIRDVASDLSIVIPQLQDRGLIFAAKWAAEQLSGIDDAIIDTLDSQTEENVEDIRLQTEIEKERRITRKERINYLKAKSFFDMKEYLRTAHFLKHSNTQKSAFLRRYSLFLAGEKQKDEQCRELNEHSPVINTELRNLHEELQRDYKSNQLDAFGKYLFGVILKELHLVEESQQLLVESCCEYPWNWSAWIALGSLCVEAEKLTQLTKVLPHHYMTEFFTSYAQLELQLNNESLQSYHSLSEMFPNSRYVTQQVATAHYNLREFDVAEKQFDKMREMDPYCIDGLDTYSNILYVLGDTAKLSYLAHYVCTIDKFCSESCYIIGNYYSLKNQHVKAILYFQRALKLNRNYLSAWTLMGHEYVELRKSEPAIHAYRKAVDCNPRDYRALYGLGQLYEVLKLTQYAIYYYHKAALLRPYDARMWCALACCYESTDNIRNAVKCYKRAVDNQDREGLAVRKLAKLYSSMNKQDKSAYYYKMSLDRLDSSDGDDKDIIEALIVLGDYCDSVGKTEEAVGYYERLMTYRGSAKEKAKERLRTIFYRNKTDQQQ